MNIKPVKTEERNLNGIDYFLFWSGVAISLAEIWAGGFLASLGFIAGVSAIILGHIAGNTFLVLGGYIGSKHGLSSMTTVRPSFGIRGANFAAVLNMIQLIGWASILLIIAGQAGAVLGRYLGGVFVYNRFWILIIGFATLVWAFYTDMRIWKYLQYFTCTFLFIIVLLMTFVTFFNFDYSGQGIHESSVQIHFMTAFDLVIAMPISFLPIAADYSRFAKNNRSAFVNTWLGYFIISSWMYVLGLGAAIYTGTTDPAMLILKTLSTLGLAVPALLLIVFSTVTSNFPDIYSATCSCLNVSEKANPKITMWIVTILTIVVALFFPMAQYENFLLFIGAMFIPLFGIVLTDYFIIRKGRININGLYKNKGEYWYRNGYNYIAVVSWAVGFTVYEIISIGRLQIGSSIPSILTAGALYYVFTKWLNR